MNQMKDSGVAWLGEIPEEWDVNRGKYVLSLLKRKVGDNSGVITCFRDGEVTLRSNRREDGFTFADKEIGYQGIKTGDLVIHGMDGFAGAIGISDSNGKGSPVLSVCREKYDAVLRYIMYYLRMLASQNVFLAIATGIRERSCDLRWNKIEELLFLLPSKFEQEKIVSFLDKKCALIDSITNDIERQIEILKQYKQSLITETVTKGLDKNVKMKDSGVEWIGEIPEGWELNKIKYISTLKGRIGWQGLTSNEYIDEGPYLITGVDFSDGTINWKKCVHISEKRWKEAPDIHIHNNDLLITKDGTVGKVALTSGLDGRASLNSGVLLISSSPLFDKKYLYWTLLSEEFWCWFAYKNSGNSTITHLYQGDFADFKFVHPSLSEQKSIAEYLDSRCSKIDAVITDKQTQLDTLKKHKQSLIYEYVTGKKRVSEMLCG